MKLARPPEFQDVAGLVDVASAGRAFPRPPGVALSYGVAGFRARAPLLESTLLRMGMLAARRSAVMGYAVGLMVTASHNAEPDNGVKLVDVDGGMLHQSWEAYAAALANADDGDLTSALAKLPGGSGAPGGAAERPSVLIAWDTRPSSERLAALAMRGAQLAGAQALTLGLLTTPQLHHIVRMSNGAAGCAAVGSRWGLPEWASEAGYYEMLAGAYAELVGVGERGAPAAVASPLDVDCACGIGAPAVERLAAALTAKLGAGAPALRVVNAPGSGELNTGCGAEHVQKAREPPRGLESVQAMVAGRAASLDGDADRIVFHYFTHAGGWALLDGDKIAALVAGFLREQLRSALRGHTAPAASAPPRATPSTAARPPRARSEEDEEEADGSELRAAVVQTAYANGASSAYLLGLGVEIAAAKTGVKFLHTQALHYDLAVYFEANGHGTALFSQRLLETLCAVRDAAGAETAAESARVLLACHRLVNQAVGDALSDLLIVDAILRRRNWSFAQWDALYEDLPSRQTKLTVADRTAISCTADETRVLHPAPLQAALDELVRTVEAGRCFVRPSGTEDAVRVYAEASTQQLADKLALDAARAVHVLAGGTGPAPDSFAA